MTAPDPVPILAALVSHAERLGVFEMVYAGEPKAKPKETGLHLAIWYDSWQSTARSGLGVTSIVEVWNARVGLPMLAQPVGVVETTAVAGAYTLIRSLNDGFTLGGLVNGVDIRGMSGIALAGRAGYLNHDGTLFRVVTVTIPLLQDDVWGQAA